VSHSFGTTRSGLSDLRTYELNLWLPAQATQTPVYGQIMGRAEWMILPCIGRPHTNPIPGHHLRLATIVMTYSACQIVSFSCPNVQAVNVSGTPPFLKLGQVQLSTWGVPPPPGTTNEKVAKAAAKHGA
jgi:hypothetical protein